MAHIAINTRLRNVIADLNLQIRRELILEQEDKCYFTVDLEDRFYPIEELHRIADTLKSVLLHIKTLTSSTQEIRIEA